MKLRLKILASSQAGVVFEHAGPKVVVGRDSTCDLILDSEENQGVSLKHAQIELTPRTARLTDLGSTNGTFVNDRRINGPVTFKCGDYIRLGQAGPTLQVLELELSPSAHGFPPIASLKPRPFATVGLANAASENVRTLPDLRADGDEQPDRAGLPSEAKRDVPKPSLPTRMLLIVMQTRQRRLWMAAGVAGTCLLIVAAILVLVMGRQVGNLQETSEQAHKRAEEIAKKTEEAAKKTPVTGQEVHSRTLRSTAWVLSPNTAGKGDSAGTGSLIDRDRKLLLTAWHVFKENTIAKVYFPESKNGEVIKSREHYLVSTFIKGRMVYGEPLHDLALIELDYVPDGAPPLRISTESPKPGERVHTVGNPGANAALWVYSVGAVRQVTPKEWSYSNGQRCNSWVIETQNPINPGDSGGPLVNDQCQLIGVNSGRWDNGEGKRDVKDAKHFEIANAYSWHIDIREIKAFLNRSGYR